VQRAGGSGLLPAFLRFEALDSLERVAEPAYFGQCLQRLGMITMRRAQSH
jgi:hypothetical protein